MQVGLGGSVVQSYGPLLAQTLILLSSVYKGIRIRLLLYISGVRIELAQGSLRCPKFSLDLQRLIEKGSVWSSKCPIGWQEAKNLMLCV